MLREAFPQSDMLTPFELGKIAAWRDKDTLRSALWIAKKMRRSRAAVQAAIANDFIYTARRERPLPMKLQIRNRILVKLARATTTKKHRKYPTYGSAQKIASAARASHGIVISARQVTRVLESHNLRPYRRQCTTTRDPDEQRERLRFARRITKKWSPKELDSICFSDETWLTCNEETSKVMYAEARHHVLPIERKAKWNVPCVMVWAAVAVGYKSPLIFFPAKAATTDDDAYSSSKTKAYRLDAPKYRDKCLAKIVPDLLKKKLILQQDGARCHVAATVMTYLRRKGVTVLEPWPAYSADLNMIEQVWHDLKMAIGEKCPLTIDELKRAATEAWAELPQSKIDAHCRNFLPKCKQVIARAARKM